MLYKLLSAHCGHAFIPYRTSYTRKDKNMALYNILHFSVSVAFMLYLFCYVLRVKSFVSSRRKDLVDDDGFDVEEFIHRMTLATGLDVKQVQSDDPEQKRSRFSLKPKNHSEIG